MEIPSSQQMRMPIEVWQYCIEIAKSQGFKNPTEAARQIIKAHQGWTTLRNEEPRR